MQSNMLSANKIKIHGMKSRRWNVTDKITQYKGLVKLYARDKKILDHDITKDRRKLKKEIRKLRHEIENQRETLDNAIQGDRQRLRNTLSDNRNLLLAYQNMHPKNVIEVLYQENFNKQKYLDKVNYAMKLRTQKLIDLKLEYAELEDRIKYESKVYIPEEDQAQIITAKVQDAIMKNETAVDVQNTYKSILNVLKKDAIYFDAVLRALQIDGYNQGKCVLKITEMGQLATEYLDDKKEEYKMLEAALKVSMMEREKSINEIRDKIDDLHGNVKYLIRRDSVIALDEEKNSKYTFSETELLAAIENVSFTLDRIQDTTVVSKFSDILPRLEEQRKQKLRLEELVALNTKNRDILLNKAKHAEEMYNNLSHVMVESTMKYKEEKLRIASEMEVELVRAGDAGILLERRGETFIKLRTSLMQLAEILRVVKDKPEPLPKNIKQNKQAKRQTNVDFKSEFNPPEKCEEDAEKLLQIISKKLKMLVKVAKEIEPDPKADPVYESFISGMIETKHVIHVEVKDDSLIDDIMFEDPLVPNRHEIKKISEEICRKNAKTEFDV